MSTVQCRNHGAQPATFVCQHILDGLMNRQRVGFFWSTSDPGKLHPDAWCKACEERVRLTNGEWVGQALEHLEPKTLCASCYDLAKQFHMGGDPWS